MARVPDELQDEFDEKGETFFEIAESLFTNPDRRYTQDELAEIVDRSNTTVSNHVLELVAAGWLKRQENQTTFVWNADAHNPASTEGITAVKRLYVDLWQLLKEHSKTVPGAFAIVGFALILAAVVLFAFFVGFSIGVTEQSSIPNLVYLVIAIGSFLTGVIVTFLSPLQAMMNRIVWRYLPENHFQDE